jgi:hypothetical protein
MSDKQSCVVCGTEDPSNFSSKKDMVCDSCKEDYGISLDTVLYNDEREAFDRIWKRR